MSEDGGYSSPGKPPDTPGLPQNPLPIVFSGYTGLNTKASQQGIGDQEGYVIDGFMPLGPNNLRSLYGLGATIYTVPGGTSPATGSIYFAANPTNGDTVTLNGVVFTFVTAGGWPTSTSNYHITIQGTAGLTVNALVTALTTGTTYLANTSLNDAQYADGGGSATDTLYITFDVVGTVGNGYTLAASRAAVSAGTLTGGGVVIKNFNFNNIGNTPLCIVCTSDGNLTQVNLNTLATTIMGAFFATGSIAFSNLPTNGDTITLNGSVFTWVTSGASPSNYQINIGSGNVGGAIFFWLLNLSTSATYLADANLNVATYSDTGGGSTDTFLITYKTSGPGGNAYTLAKSCSVATLSGAHLTGGMSAITAFPPDYAQWAGQYIIIAAAQTNGYYLWDGTNLYFAGTIAPQVDVINSGANYTSAPTITANITGSSGTGATFTGTVINGSLASILVNTPGTGYLVSDDIVLTITGGGSDDMARAVPHITSSDRGVSAALVTLGGSQYSALAYAVISNASPTVAATLAISGTNGVITGITVINPGLGYAGTEPLKIHDSGSGAGTGATGVAVYSKGQISSATVKGHGTNYTSPPTLTVIGDGVNAQLQAILSSNNTVKTISVINGGYNYTNALIQFNGGNNGAAASAAIMPFGVSGSTVETYEGRVWVGNGRFGQVSAPGNPADFSAIDGATAFENTNSFQQYTYEQFSQSNGFLYLFSDSSLDYVSGVVTSGNPANTTFNNLNVDPQTGTPWHSTVQAFGRDLVFANPIGVYVSYGGAVTKVSDALDGIYNTAPQSTWPLGFQPSAAVMQIFGIKVYVLVLPIIDQVSGNVVIKCLMWDGKKWWTSPQEGFTNPFIATQKLNSVLTAYASPNGTTIKPMFNVKSEGFNRYLYSKLWDNPGVWLTKINREMFGLFNVNYVDPMVAATGSIYFSTNPSPGDTVTLNGVPIEFVASGASGYQFTIAGTTGATIFLFAAALNGTAPFNTNPALTVATYSDTGGTGTDSLVATYKTTGSAGNAFTLQASAASAPGVPSNPTLTGGSDGPSFFIAPITEGGVGTETAVVPGNTGPYLFGPLPDALQGRLIGVRVRTTMADIQINTITPWNNIQQNLV